MRQTYETGQPWVVYTYGLTHDGWWPMWTSTRVLGRARIGMTCAVCGVRETTSIRIPRFRPIPDKGHHPERLRFLGQHSHPDKGNLMSWQLPFLNPIFLNDLDLDLLAMRLEADLNEGP